MSNSKRKRIVAIAGAAAIVAASLSTPAWAHGGKGGRGGDAANQGTSQTSSSSSTSSQSAQSAQSAQGTQGMLEATITGVPSSVTDAFTASAGAYFTAYQLDAAATTLPAAQPTTGAIRIGVRGGTLTAGTLSGNTGLPGAAASSTTKYAVYPSTGGSASLVTVSVSSAGIATATASTPLTATYDATVASTRPTRGDAGQGGAGQPSAVKVRGGKGGHGGKGNLASRDTTDTRGVAATINVPSDGKTYSVRITETAEKGVAVTNPVARRAIPLTGTGALAVRLPLGPSDTYKVELITADGTVAASKTVTVAADGTLTTPLVLG